MTKKEYKSLKIGDWAEYAGEEYQIEDIGAFINPMDMSHVKAVKLVGFTVPVGYKWVKLLKKQKSCAF